MNGHLKYIIQRLIMKKKRTNHPNVIKGGGRGAAENIEDYGGEAVDIFTNLNM